MQLSYDGSKLNHGSFNRLYNTDGSGVLQLAAYGATLTGDPPLMVGSGDGGFQRSSMSRDATRFLFYFNLGYVDGAPTPAQLGLLELNPGSLGQAPALADPKIAPSYVVIGDSKTSISVRMNTANTHVRTNSVAFRNGVEVNTNIVNSAVLYDDGSYGDATAGDGRFTNNTVGASASAPLGPHTVRMKTEVRAADGRRHATALDVAQLDVVTTAPPGMGTCTPTPTPTQTRTATPTTTPTRTPTPTVGLPDLTISRLEVNQAIQNDANSIPLIASKRTVVRAYVGSELPPCPSAASRASCRAIAGATLLGTVAPFNPGGRITVVQPADWRQINHTLNFEVPFGWLTGDVRLEVEVNTDRAVPESNYGNNTTSFNARFVDGGDLRIAWLPIHYVTGGYTGPQDPTDPHRQRGRLAESHLSGQPHPRQVLSLAGHHLGRQHQHRHGRHQAAQLPGAPVPAQPEPAPGPTTSTAGCRPASMAATGWRGCPARLPSATTPTAAGAAPSRTSWGTTATWAIGMRRSAYTVLTSPRARCGRTPGSTSWSPAGWRTKPGSRRKYTPTCTST